MKPEVYLARAERYYSMEYCYCGRSGLQLPRISLGLWHNFGSVDPCMVLQRKILVGY